MNYWYKKAGKLIRRWIHLEVNKVIGSNLCEHGQTNWKISDQIPRIDWFLAVGNSFVAVQILHGRCDVDIFHLLHDLQVPVPHGIEECQRDHIFLIRVSDRNHADCENSVVPLPE